MERYAVTNEHLPEECEAMEGAMEHIPPHLTGKELICTCESGVHGFFMVVEGESPDQVLAALPEELRLGSTRALPAVVFTL